MEHSTAAEHTDNVLMGTVQILLLFKMDTESVAIK